MKQKINTNKNTTAFTIVELLVVIVVIGILALITTVSYSGVSQKAVVASIQSDLSNASKQIKMFQAENGTYPTVNNCPNAGAGEICLKSSNDSNVNYSANNISRTFCLNVTNGSQSYKTTQDNTFVSGNCLVYGLVMDLDAGNASSYPGSGITWNDLSGNGNNGTLQNGTAYSATNGGNMIFDGIDDYVSIANTSTLNGLTQVTIEAWVKPVSNLYIFQHGSSSSINGYINRFQVGVSGDLYLDIEDIISSAHFSASSANSVVQMNVWNHVSAVVRRNLFEFYVNGNKVFTSNNFNGMYGTLNCSDLARNVGRYYYNSGTISYSNGAIGRVRVYNRALSGGEVMQSFDADRSRYGL